MSKWEWKKLGEVCEIARGGSPRPIKEYITSDADGINWIKIGDTDPTGKYIFSTEEKIKPSGIKKSRYVESGDFLLSNSMSFGRPYILKTNGCIHDGWLVLKNYQKYLDVNFFYHLLSSPIAQEQFNQEAKGSTVRNLNTDIVSKVYVPIPPLSEQKRIVKFLDEEFSKIDTLKTNAETNLKNAKELFETTLEKELNPPSRHSERSEKSSADLPSGWEWKSLQEISNVYGEYGLSVPSTSYNGIRYLRITDITDDGRLNDEYVSADIEKVEESDKLQEGDILFARTGATVGKTLIFKEDYGCCVFAGYLIRYRPKKEVVLPFYLHYVTHSKYYFDWVKKSQKAAAQPNISAKLYNAFQIPLPPLSVQKEIVARLDKLSENVKRLEANYKQIIADCDELKKSILKKTFEGES